MRYLGLDLGTKTLGLALSDPLGIIASSYGTLRFENEDYDSLLPKIKKIVDEEKVDTIVLGLPRNMNNTIGERAETTLKFKEKLENYLNMEVFLQDERLSSVEANNYLIASDLSRKKRKQVVDAVAATIILETFMERRGNYERRNNDF